jgi:phosphoglycolate phosphatase-like HAD superfamily hydrolase
MPTTDSALLPSWRPGPTRDAVTAFLTAAESLPVDQRVAAFDNDGTLWCERPTYVQYDFFEDVLRRAAEQDPTVRQRPELSAVLDGDMAAIGEIGLERIAMALVGLCVGMSPEEFTARVREFVAGTRHRTLGVPVRGTVYQPMLELLAELRRRDFAVFVVTGGGTEFVRALSDEFYEVPPEGVVGTLVDYDLVRRADGTPGLQRSGRVLGTANEGAAKVGNIQTQLGRRPVLAAGNSGGDREMLEWACAGGSPCLALLVDHDDGDREFRYVSTAQTFTEPEPITDVGARLGWTVVSMAGDWATVFPDR